MRILADKHEAGTIPQELDKVRTLKAVLHMVSTSSCHPDGSCYAYAEDPNSFIDNSDAAQLLRGLADQSKTQEEKQQQVEERRRQEVKNMEDKLRGVKILGFFPTPKAVAEQMVDAANIQSDEAVLEPSAGIGSIAEVIAAIEGVDLVCCELSFQLQEILEVKGFSVLPEGDFLQVQGNFDKIIMNPPFEKGQDIKHLRHAFDLLNPGGRVVCLVANGAAFNRSKSWIESMGWYKSIGAAFNGCDAFRSTGVNINMVVLDKPEK